MTAQAPQAGHPTSGPRQGPMTTVERLASEIGPRRPTGPAERRAAELLRGLLEDAGAPAELQSFRGYASFGAPFGLIMSAAALPSLLPANARRARVALAATATAALLTEGSLRFTPLTRALSRWSSQNVVAAVEPTGSPRRTLCLTAHLDTSRSGLMFDPRFVGLLGAWITLNSLLVAGCGLAEPLLGRRRGGRRLQALARSLIAAGLGLIAERELRGVDVPGANDNASGCAVVVELAREIAARPLASTRAVICLTGCEEAGTLGARAFLDRHRTEGWLFLNFDNVGAGASLRYLRREGVIAKWAADPELIAIASAIEKRRPELRMAPEDAPAGLTYDSSPVLAAGGRALTLSIQDGSIPNLHWPTDTLANVDPEGVERALKAGRELVAAIDRGDADRPSP